MSMLRVIVVRSAAKTMNTAVSQPWRSTPRVNLTVRQTVSR